MFSKIFIVLALVCVVNASVLTGNDFNETKIASNPKSCNFQECNQRCRRLKFRGGACVKGSCKCDNFLNAEDVSEEKPSDLEELLSLKDAVSEKSLTDLENSVFQPDDHETEVKASPSRCNFKACDGLCRSLNKLSGSCINGHCKCEKSVIAEDDSETEVQPSSKRCNLKVCDWLCRRLNNSSGTCDSGRCKCEKSLIAEDDLKAEAETSKCNFRACYSQCRSANYISGACVKGRCKCTKTHMAEEDPETEVPTSERRCSYKECYQQCRRDYFISGTCVNGSCQCKGTSKPQACPDKVEVPEESVSILEDLDLQQDDLETEVETKKDDCNPQECDQRCRRLKFRGGACVKGRCKCDNFLKAEVSDESLSTPEDSVSPKACRSDKCNEICRKIKLRGLPCIDGRCICNKYFFQQEDAVAEANVEEYVASRACNNKRCHQICRKQKFRGGSCVGANCYCNKFLSLLDDTMTDPETSSLTLVTP